MAVLEAQEAKDENLATVSNSATDSIGAPSPSESSLQTPLPRRIHLKIKQAAKAHFYQPMTGHFSQRQQHHSHRPLIN